MKRDMELLTECGRLERGLRKTVVLVFVAFIFTIQIGLGATYRALSQLTLYIYNEDDRSEEFKDWKDRSRDFEDWELRRIETITFSFSYRHERVNESNVFFVRMWGFECRLEHEGNLSKYFRGEPERQRGYEDEWARMLERRLADAVGDGERMLVYKQEEDAGTWKNTRNDLKEAGGLLWRRFLGVLEFPTENGELRRITAEPFMVDNQHWAIPFPPMKSLTFPKGEKLEGNLVRYHVEDEYRHLGQGHPRRPSEPEAIIERKGTLVYDMGHKRYVEQLIQCTAFMYASCGRKYRTEAVFRLELAN